MTLEEYKQSIIEYMDFGIIHTDLQDAYSIGFRNGIKWCKSLMDGVEPIYESIADTSQTDWEKEKYEKSLCNFCGKNCDNRKRNLYMVECNRYEPQMETINLQGGEDVHNFCKRCKESRVRHFYGEPYIVCKQVDDAPSICLKKCPLSKWIAEDVYLIIPQMEKTCNNCGHDKAMCLYCEERNKWTPQTERNTNEN